MFPSDSYLGNGGTEYAEIWCVVRYQLAMRITPLMGGVYLHVRTLFRFLETARLIAMKFGILLETN